MGMLTREQIARERDPEFRRYLESLDEKYIVWRRVPGEGVPNAETIARLGVTCLLSEIVGDEDGRLREYDVVSKRLFRRQRLAPFLLTEDIDALTERWCAERSHPAAPREAVFDRLTNAHFRLVRRFFPDAFLVKSKIFRDELCRLARDTPPSLGWPTVKVSLDRDFVCSADAVVEVTRVREHRTFKYLGELARPGCPSLREQARLIASRMPLRTAVEILVDGCWSGSEVLLLAEEFKRIGVPVDRVVTEILVREAAAEFAAYGLPVIGGRYYPNLHSWICQRDFFPGIPRSGANIGYREGKTYRAFPEDIGAPYILPFREDVFPELGDHDRMELSIESLRIADALYAAVEQSWGRPVLVQDLSRIPTLVVRGATRVRSEFRRIAGKYLRAEDAFDSPDPPTRVGVFVLTGRRKGYKVGSKLWDHFWLTENRSPSNRSCGWRAADRRAWSLRMRRACGFARAGKWSSERCATVR